MQIIFKLDAWVKLITNILKMTYNRDNRDQLVEVIFIKILKQLKYKEMEIFHRLKLMDYLKYQMQIKLK